MKRVSHLLAAALPLAIGLSACADWDNPTALSELAPEVEFEIEAAEIETFEEVEIHVHVSESGAPMQMHRSQLEIQHADGGEPRLVEMEPEGDGYAAHVLFFEQGEYHLHFHGQPKGHAIMAELGEHEIDVHRQHRVIGPYLAELEVSPAPVEENSTAHVMVFVFDLQPDGSAGAPAGGLDVEMAIHAPDGDDTALSVVEEDTGEYEGEYSFGNAGMYELHVEILVGTVHEEGEFHIPVLSPEGEGDTGGEGGGHGHG
ncbi:MAG: hypothetical protein GTO22_15055 [Gemmatimonadales bacterium]|nr:hypothetical protein [Gemmatimonadales bacterium]